MSPLQLSASNCLQSLCLSIGMWAYKRYLLHVSWRKTYTTGTPPRHRATAPPRYRATSRLHRHRTA